ncbi:MAG: thioredoxin family protein [Phycisphaerae bacterium]|nr:thioredoxin family protein [Phycisphaerae bacterium]
MQVETPTSGTADAEPQTTAPADASLADTGAAPAAESDAAVLDLLNAATQPAVAEAQPAGLPRVVDLGADKCIPCKKLAPILEELKNEYAGRVTVEFIDVWKDPKAGEPYNIRLIPTQVFFDRDGKEVWRHEGFLPKADFVAKFAELGVE